MNNTFGVEYHLIDSCNLNCAGCSHYSSLSDDKQGVSLETLRKELLLLKEKTNDGMSLDWIRLLGGEPLLHKDINQCIHLTRELFPITKISIVTNGLLLSKKQEDFFETCVANDVKIQITDYGILDIEELHSKITNRGVKCDVYRNGTNWYLKNIRLTSGRIDCLSHCYHKNTCNNYRKGRIYLCPQIAYIDVFNTYFNKNVEVHTSDYIELNEISNFKELVYALQNCKPRFCYQFCNNINKDGTTVHKSERTNTKRDINEFCEL